MNRVAMAASQGINQVRLVRRNRYIAQALAWVPMQAVFFAAGPGVLRTKSNAGMPVKREYHG